MMTCMAKKTNAQASAKPPRKRDEGKVVAINFEADPSLDDALEMCAHNERRTRKAVLTLALEAYLRNGGYWPPKGA